MKADFYIHGVPYGFSYKGATGEKDVFFKRYYENRRGINEMRIEAVNANGSNHYYYTYIIGKNVFDGENGRSGAYFGITVRLYQYYTKAQNLYYLLDSFFNSYLLNQIITYANNSYKFRIKEFDNNTTINQSLPELEKLISMAFSKTDLRNLKFNRSNGYAKIHFADASEDEVQKALVQYGEVSISYTYPSMAMERLVVQKNDEIQKIQNKAYSDVATAKQEKETAIKEIRREYADKDKKIDKLKSEVEKEKAEAASNLRKYKEKENELIRTKGHLQDAQRELKQCENIKHQFEQINSIVKGYSTTQGAGQAGGAQKSKGSISRLILALLQVVLSLLILLFLIFNSCSETLIPSISPDEEIEIENDTITNIGISDSQVIDHETQYSDAKIDVKEFTRTDTLMKVGTEYSIKVKNLDPSVKGSWKSPNTDNVRFIEGTGDGYDKVSISKPGDYEISYEVNYKQITSRTLHVVQ